MSRISSEDTRKQGRLFDLIYRTEGVGVFLFVIGLTLGLFLSTSSQEVAFSVKRANDPNLTLTNPLLSCSISENKEFDEYKPLEKSINSILDKADKTKVTTASVYYRELKNGRWFGINENEVYSPASLLKVPVMIAYLKETETNPNALSSRVYYSGVNTLSSGNEFYAPKVTIKSGQSYTVESLIEAMIEHSDNAAADLLYKNMDQDSLAEVMTDIGIHLPKNSQSAGITDFLTVKSYAYLFRLLYNSTYLSHTMSEKALKLLSSVDFKQGLRGGVPDSVIIADKFGERTVLNNDLTLASRELHDCGIVYYPEHPYLLCVMTKGTDFEALSSVIGSISSLVYKNTESQYK